LRPVNIDAPDTVRLNVGVVVVVVVVVVVGLVDEWQAIPESAATRTLKRKTRIVTP